MTRGAASLAAILWAVGAAIGCAADAPAIARPPAPAVAAETGPVVRAAFDDLAELTRWSAELPGVAATVVSAVVEGRPCAELAPAGAGVARLYRRIDASALRGQRIQLTARLRAVDAVARATVRVRRAGAASGIGDVAETPEQRADRWSEGRAALDVTADAAEVEIEVSARGPGRAWIDRVTVERLGRPAPAAIAPRPLAAAEREQLAALARLLGLVRYFHPSDESAALDWNAFAPPAVARVLAAGGAPLEDVLGEILRPIAPTARVYREGQAAPAVEVPTGPVLTWWHHAGLGPDAPYLGFRVGVDQPDASAVVYVPVPPRALAGCRRATASARADQLAGMKVALQLRFLRPGTGEDLAGEPMRAGAITPVAHDVPADTVQVQVGLEGSGDGTVAVSGLRFACDGRPAVALDPATALGDGIALAGSLYDRGVEPCAAGRCLRLRRRAAPPPPGAGGRWIDVAIGSGLRLRMPLVLARVGGRTVPAGSPAAPLAAASVWDRSTRLAAVVMAWTTLDHFYPYFAEARVDWSRELGPALDEASRAASPDQTRAALAHLVARLADDHARVVHPGRSLAGMVPLSLRMLGGELVVTGGADPYLRDAPIGSAVLSIDGSPAGREYARVAGEVSAATDGWRDYAAPLYLSMGPIGAMRRLQVRGADGQARELVLPVLSREAIADQVREPRPRTGAELAPGVMYVDLEGLDAATWKGLVERLARARGIVFDMRGYPTAVAWDVVSHLADREVSSPLLDIPVVRATGTAGHDRTWWHIRPRAPHVRAPVVFLVDGRTASAGETLMQIIRDHRLGVLVGEPTGGTNGNPVVFAVPGGFGVRFTGMRVLGLRGDIIHARGIAPDVVAHPTLAGVRARRDELLEAGVRAVRDGVTLRGRALHVTQGGTSGGR